MAGLSEEEIRVRAYHLWTEVGEPAGRMDTFWSEAEKQLLAAASTLVSIGDVMARHSLPKKSARHARPS
ncbi:DUF2934 domain-containing protein [Bradyrhizobium sp. CB2312]|uniref:DUF2934 domain-containing protein n=1 Tax=Bradyrhizobium sp. CB2312 TaxID=3039155 RepID=UPI0024B14C6A|nr:DUF2934 domain-containing protein [Bradyrhizobium sp. CB2312]WFU69242.1 DUF2934 domain-containing protein [Bradyrhizobium sp. CB2312]